MFFFAEWVSLGGGSRERERERERERARARERGWGWEEDRLGRGGEGWEWYMPLVAKDLLLLSRRPESDNTSKLFPD
jgi:hypothetical protein